MSGKKMDLRRLVFVALLVLALLLSAVQTVDGGNLAATFSPAGESLAPAVASIPGPPPCTCPGDVITCGDRPRGG